jgi:ATP-dependent DNA ligase
MLAFDCIHETHEDAQLTAATRRELVEKVREHFGQYHPEVSEKEVDDIVEASAYVVEVRARTLERGRALDHGGLNAEDENGSSPLIPADRASG